LITRLRIPIGDYYIEVIEAYFSNVVVN
jgi:hypothetical protein